MPSSGHERGTKTHNFDRGQYSRVEEICSVGGKPSPALDAAIADAISLAERIMLKIDSRWAAPTANQSMTSSAGYPWKGQR